MPAVTVEDYGVVAGNGVSDAQAVLNAQGWTAAIAAAAASAPRTVQATDPDGYAVKFVQVDPYTNNDASCVVLTSSTNGVHIFGAGDTPIWERTTTCSPFHAAACQDFEIEGFVLHLVSPGDCNAVKAVDCDNGYIHDCTADGGRIGFADIGSRHMLWEDLTSADMNAAVNTDEKGFSCVLVTYTDGSAVVHEYVNGFGSTFRRCTVTNAGGTLQYGLNVGGVAHHVSGAIYEIKSVTIEDFVCSGAAIYGGFNIYDRNTVWTVSKQGQGSILTSGFNGMTFDKSVNPTVRGMTVSQNQQHGIECWGVARPVVEHATIENNGRQTTDTYHGIYLRQAGRPQPTTHARIEACNIGQTLAGNRQASGITAVTNEALYTHRVGGRFYGMTTRYSLGTTGIDTPVHIDEPPRTAPVRSNY